MVSILVVFAFFCSVWRSPRAHADVLGGMDEGAADAAEWPFAAPFTPSTCFAAWPFRPFAAPGSTSSVALGDITAWTLDRLRICKQAKKRSR